MLTNFELKRLKPKLDIAKKPENRVHELTDSNVTRLLHRADMRKNVRARRNSRISARRSNLEQNP